MGSPPPRVGTTFAGYRIERILGRGGMSVVYLAEHPRLKNAVALKLLAPELAEDDVFRERLLRESRLAASVNHPNVVPVYDTGEEDGTLFISMRFVDGRDLRRTLREDGMPPVDDTLALCAQVAAALDAAHRHGLVHRDVKPANVLIQQEPQHVYVADFGLTKHSDARSGATASGLVGTIDYMAPEQIEGRSVDGRADLYALACIAFECLTGRVPFRADSEVAVLWAHMRSEPPLATDANSSLPRALDAVFRRALAKDPRDRHESCAGLVEELRAASATRRRRRVSSPSLRIRVPRGRRRALWAALAGMVVGAAATFAIVAPLHRSRGALTRTVVVRPSLTVPERLLTARVPPMIRGSCDHAAPPSPDFDAALTCRAPGPVTVSYAHAIGGARMKTALVEDAVAAGATPPGKSVLPRGRCGATATSIRDWTIAAPGEREQVVGRPRAPAHGRLLCFSSSNGWSAVEWTDTTVDVLARATGLSPARLYAWWTRHGGPVTA
jgi:serine/threonine-protein kinase